MLIHANCSSKLHSLLCDRAGLNTIGQAYYAKLHFHTQHATPCIVHTSPSHASNVKLRKLDWGLLSLSGHSQRPLWAFRLHAFLQATTDAHDGDFVIPTVRPLSRGSSRHSILASPSHDAQHNKAQGYTDRSARRSSSRKTSFNLGQEAAHLPESPQLSVHPVPSQIPANLPDQQQSVRDSVGESAAESRQHSVSMMQQKPESSTVLSPGTHRQTQDPKAQDQDVKQAAANQHLGQTRSQGAASKTLPSKPVQKRDKAVRPIQDWVGLGSKKQAHKQQ